MLDNIFFWLIFFISIFDLLPTYDTWHWNTFDCVTKEVLINAQNEVKVNEMKIFPFESKWRKQPDFDKKKVKIFDELE